MLQLRRVRGFRKKQFLHGRIFQSRSKRRIFLYVREIFVALVLGLAKVMDATVEVPGLRVGFRQHVIKAPAIVNGAVLQDRPAARAIVLEKLRIKDQRVMERCDSFLVFLVLQNTRNPDCCRAPPCRSAWQSPCCTP